MNNHDYELEKRYHPENFREEAYYCEVCNGYKDDGHPCTDCSYCTGE